MNSLKAEPSRSKEYVLHVLNRISQFSVILWKDIECRRKERSKRPANTPGENFADKMTNCYTYFQLRNKIAEQMLATVKPREYQGLKECLKVPFLQLTALTKDSKRLTHVYTCIDQQK